MSYNLALEFSFGIVFDIALFKWYINIFMKNCENKQNIELLKNSIDAILYVALIVFNYYYILYRGNSDIVYYIVVTSLMFVMTLNFKENISYKISLTLIYGFMSMAMHNLMTDSFAILFGRQPSKIAYDMVVFIVYVCKLLTIIVLDKIVTDIIRKSDARVDILLIIETVISAVIVSMTSNIGYNKKYNITIEDEMILLCVILLNFLLYLIIYAVRADNRKKSDLEYLRQEIKSSQEIYDNIQRSQSELRDIRHDMKNRLVGLYELVDKNDCSEAIRYLDNILDNIDKASEFSYCNNTLINSILNYKAPVKDDNIDFRYKIEVSESLNIDRGDLGVIIGNLLDNACNACREIEEDKPYIEISIISHINILMITVENNYVDKPVIKDRNYILNHGRGITNVKNIVNKYNGEMNIVKEKSVYRTEIMIIL